MSDANEHRNEHEEAASDASFPAHLDGQARAFEDAAAFIESRCSAISDTSAFAICQKSAVEEWAHQCDTLIEISAFASLEVVSDSTSEHKVFYRASDNRAIKRTWAGVYGQIPIPNNGKLDRRNACPSEYLHRMALQISVFKSDIKLVGVAISDEPSMIIGQPPREPSFVISQEWFEKETAPSLDEIAVYLESEGFKHCPMAYFGWYRLEDGVVIVDAKPDNFIKTVVGLVPIDLQMLHFSIRQMKEAGLKVPL